MSDVWITSDTHWSHTNIIRYQNRPFVDVEEMDKSLFRGWRETVKPDDTIIHLGDVCFKWSKERTTSILASLPGHKILIMGNHDRSHSPNWWKEVGFEEVYSKPFIYKEKYVLSHEEIDFSAYGKHITFNVFGHIHSNKKDKKNGRCVSVECTDYKPVLFSSIIPESIFGKDS